jgi:hypothetical protein
LLPDILIGSHTGTGSFSVPVPIPPGPWMAGYHIYSQILVVGSSGALTPVLDSNLQRS